MSDEAKRAESASGNMWAEFWSGTHSIYVNGRHMQVHYERIAEDIARLIAERRARNGSPLVLDWGCGDALNAPRLAGLCRELWLYDAVGTVQDRIAARFANVPGIRVLDNAAWQSVAPASLDMIVVVSVAQYLSRADLEALMERFRGVLRPDGEAIFADIIPPHVSMIADVGSLLGSGLRHGFFFAACAGLARTFFSEYRRLRAKAGFSCYDADDFLALLGANGFAAERLARNVGFNQQRMTFRALPRNI